MGEPIALQGWQEYSGGLDTSCTIRTPYRYLYLSHVRLPANLTGPKSIFTKWRDHNVMYHVAPMLPTDPKDPQRVRPEIILD